MCVRVCELTYYIFDPAMDSPHCIRFLIKQQNLVTFEPDSIHHNLCYVFTLAVNT